jgi:hypothetical protein
MQELKIVPMSTAVADTVRSTMKAPEYGFPAHREVAAGRAAGIASNSFGQAPKT